MMDNRAAKLALARKKLKDHQDKKLILKEENVQVKNEEEHTREPLDDFEIFNSSLLNEEIMKESRDCNNKSEMKLKTHTSDPDVKLTEMLITNKRNLEMQLIEIQTKLTKMEHVYEEAINNNNLSKQAILKLEKELKNVNEKYFTASELITTKDQTIKELNEIKSTLMDENNNLHEQLEFTKTILTKKELEVASLSDKLCDLQNRFDVMNLQLQQLSNGPHAMLQQNKNSEIQLNPEALIHKISSLEQQLKNLHKERDQINLHYEQYVSELNDHIKAVVAKNEELASEIQNLTTRESNLIDQISDLELKLQNYQTLETVPTAQPESVQNTQDELEELQKKLDLVQGSFQELSHNYEELQKKHTASETRLNELIQEKESGFNHDNLCMSKLNQDMANDKVAAQRATEQNKKLKLDLQKLEEAFVKISQDKLELTEKVQAEKYLNRELTIKLADIEEKTKDIYTKLMAKDEEMMRLQVSYREIETKYEKLLETAEEKGQSIDLIKNLDSAHMTEKCTGLNVSISESIVEQKTESEYDCLQEGNNSKVPQENNSKVPQDDAMSKLQNRFLKIMEEVADLSDEKHRLEHIILQLQNETDTICEYVALYQQQRSLLKKRDEERSAQIKIFQTECELLKNQLEELSGIIIKLTKDTELSVYFEDQSRQNDISKVMSLLSKLKNSSFIDCNRKSSELKDFYPCSCCSGKLIDV